ncbi:MAG: hypothetical protein IJ960_03905 [Oscillospiraceae bacterium]|nr:hypothetical protein [Oscillospiraceae bacterium]
MIYLTFISRITEYFKSLNVEELINDRLIDPLTTFLQSGIADGFLRNLFWMALVLCAFGITARLFLGKGSGFSQAISACMSIQFTYLFAIGLYVLLPVLRTKMAALPFVEVSSVEFHLWELINAPNGILIGGMVRLALLSLVVNLLEERMPGAKKLLPWLLCRVVNAVLSIAVYSFLCLLLESAFPWFFDAAGALMVLAVWGLIILVGLIRGLMNVALATVPKMIEKVYTFFYSREKDKDKDKGPGKVITKSIYSALAFLVVVLILNRESVGVFSFSDFSVLSLVSATVIVIVTTKLFASLF